MGAQVRIKMPFKLIYELEKLLSICYNPKELAMTEQSGLPLPQRGLHKLQTACKIRPHKVLS